MTGWSLWAHERDGLFWHVGARRWVELHGLKDPIVPVSVELDESGRYYGWQDIDKFDDPPDMIWPSPINFEVCFPYGSASAVKAGQGRVVRLRIERREDEHG